MTDAGTARRLVLTFHGVGTPPRPIRESEHEVWIDESQLAGMLDAARRRDGVAITFDDGNASDVEIALPALVDRGLTATFFILAGRLDDAGSVTREQVRELAAAGMGIGSHGVDHRSWRDLTPEALADELSASKAALEEAGGAQVSEASCPFGEYDRAVLRAVRRAGYSRVATSDGGWARATEWIEPRNTVHRGETLDDVLAAAGPSRIRRVKSFAKRWR